MRAYTPSSQDDALGYFELVVKIYFANQHPRFPDGGEQAPAWRRRSLRVQRQPPRRPVAAPGHCVLKRRSLALALLRTPCLAQPQSTSPPFVDVQQAR
jgi:hypothetical protein